MGLITEDMEFRGDTSFTGQLYPPNSSIKNHHITTSPADRIAASKVVHQYTLDEELAEQATAVAAVQRLIHIVRGSSATVEAIEVACVTAPSGDYTATVDLQKSTGGGAFASILTSTITINSSSTALTAIAGVISSTSLTDGDILKLVVTVSGTSGSQAQGLIASVTITEEPT